MIIYCITNLVNHKRYIGQTRNSLRKRYPYGFTQSPSNLHLKNAYSKYGHENFSLTIITRCDSLEALNYWEKYYINLYETNEPDKGYNKDSGGNDKVVSLETLQKMSEIGKALWECPVFRAKQSVSSKLKFETNPELLEAMKITTQELWKNEEFRQKVSLARREYFVTNPEGSLKARNSYLKSVGKPPEDSIKPVYVFDRRDGQLIGSWICRIDCCRTLGMSNGAFRNSLNKVVLNKKFVVSYDPNEPVPLLNFFTGKEIKTGKLVGRWHSITDCEKELAVYNVGRVLNGTYIHSCGYTFNWED